MQQKEKRRTRPKKKKISSQTHILQRCGGGERESRRKKEEETVHTVKKKKTRRESITFHRTLLLLYYHHPLLLQTSEVLDVFDDVVNLSKWLREQRGVCAPCSYLSHIIHYVSVSYLPLCYCCFFFYTPVPIKWKIWISAPTETTRGQWQSRLVVGQ